MADRWAGFMNSTPLELRCVWLPDRWGHAGKVAQHREAASLVGGRPAMLPAIWLPDDDNRPRPGHPWVEFGRMTLDPAPDTATHRVFAPAANVPGENGSESQAEDPRTERSLAPVPRFTDGRGELAAAMALWGHLSDPSSILAALDPTSATDPFVTGRWLDEPVGASTKAQS